MSVKESGGKRKKSGHIGAAIIKQSVEFQLKLLLILLQSSLNTCLYLQVLKETCMCFFGSCVFLGFRLAETKWHFFNLVIPKKY
jgi:hypothetical protein